MTTQLASSREVARILVTTGAVTFRTEPFYRFTSGVDSPVYVDNRRLLGHVAERESVVARLTEAVMPLSPQAVAGTATAGIPWASWIAARLQLPLLYVRSTAKGWGHQRAVEGYAPEGAQVVVIEDLAFSAGSLAASTTNLRQGGFVVDASLSIVSYETPSAAARIAELGLTHTSLTTIDQALEEAKALDALTGAQADVVTEWLGELRSGAENRGHE